jgi:hypothetical protein
MTAAAKFFEELDVAFTEPPGTGVAALTHTRELYTRARGAFNAADAAASCIDYFLHLGPEVDQPRRDEFIDTHIRRQRNRLEDILREVANQRFWESTSTTFRLDITSSGADLRVEGERRAWFLVLYLLLKNAAEASPPESEIVARLEIDADRWRADLVIENACKQPLNAAELSRMNRALSGELDYIEPNASKSGSHGLGVATAGKILKALGRTSAVFKVDQDSSHVLFSLNGIPLK